MPPFDPEVYANAQCAIVSGTDRTFGLAVFHEELRSFRICEFGEDSQLSRTEALLLQLQPRSCCFYLQDAADKKKLGRLAESCGVPTDEAKAGDMKTVDLEQDLLRLLEGSDSCGLSRHIEEQRQKTGMKALALLIGQRGLLAEPSNFNSCSLGLYPLKSFVFLDKAAFSALNVLPRPDESLRASTSLLGFLNRCGSPLGQQRLRQWLTQPLTSPQEVSRRHDIVEALHSNDGLLRLVEAQLRHVPDLEKLAAKLHRTANAKSKGIKASLEDLVLLYRCVVGVEKMLEALSGYQGLHREVLLQTLVLPLTAAAQDFKNFKALVEQAIDLKQAEQRNYCVSTAFDLSLKELALERDRVREKMEAVRKEVEGKLNIAGRANEKPVSLTDCPEGQALRVTKKHQQAVSGHKGAPTLKVLSIKKMEVIFTTPELERLNKHLSQAITDYQRQSEQLVNKALAVASTYSSVVERFAETLGSLDVLAAFARVALSAPCTFVRANLDPTGKTFSIHGAVHVLVAANSERSFVANDLQMNQETSRLHLITGPNMGGKSTYIRSVALIALMNQIGSFVPCRNATLPCFDAIMCRVGASDMQLRGISTFMAEMLEAATILKTASDRALVVIDELGRGTSTSDGFGLAWAIARYLVEDVRCFSLFATHFHELAALQDAVEGVSNRHATALVDPASGKLTFLYSLAEGAADQSYGAHVAELAGFPSHVVAASRRKAEEFEASSGFGRAAKRPRTERSASSSVADVILAATTEEEFVQRALELLPKLREEVAARSPTAAETS